MCSKISLSSPTHLELVELEAEDVYEGVPLTGVVMEKREEELVLLQVALKCLQDNVQHSVRIKVETTCTHTHTHTHKT